MRAEVQRGNVRLAAQALAPLARLNQLLISQRNGPQVGLLALQAAAYPEVEAYPLDVLGAQTEGMIGYLIEQELSNVLPGNMPIATLLTMVEVDPQDPAFQNPSKPIGYFYSEQESRALGEELGWTMREDSGRGWRHVVPSPRPKHIVDISLIQAVASRGAVVIAGGGGGVPVIRGPNCQRRGVEAVIDKDRTSALMANVLRIDDIMILTAVRRVAINYGRPEQRELDRVTLAEIRKLHAEGHFPPGSMGPKIDAAFQFLEGGGKRVMIGRLEDALPILRGETGTRIVAD